MISSRLIMNYVLDGSPCSSKTQESVDHCKILMIQSRAVSTSSPQLFIRVFGLLDTWFRLIPLELFFLSAQGSEEEGQSGRDSIELWLQQRSFFCLRICGRGRWKTLTIKGPGRAGPSRIVEFRDLSHSIGPVLAINSGLLPFQFNVWLLFVCCYGRVVSVLLFSLYSLIIFCIVV